MRLAMTGAGQRHLGFIIKCLRWSRKELRFGFNTVMLSRSSGNLKEAETAYRRAIEIDDQLPDSHLQLGHALKLLGQVEEAITAYRKAYALDPTSAVVALELRVLDPDFDLRDSTRTELGEKKESIVFDLSDLFFYLRDHPTLSGIQRVQAGVAEAVLKLQRGAARKFKFIIDGGALGACVELPPTAIPRTLS